jgi:hypothetical protein
MSDFHVKSIEKEASDKKVGLEYCNGKKGSLVMKTKKAQPAFLLFFSISSLFWAWTVTQTNETVS